MITEDVPRETFRKAVSDVQIILRIIRFFPIPLYQHILYAIYLFAFQAMYINESYYNDIIDERNCIKICGYCLCSKELNNVPKQQYHISAKHNKVFDITERKVKNSSIQSYTERLQYSMFSSPIVIYKFQKFCSNICYKSSNFYKDQLQSSPLWMRDDSNPAVVNLFDEMSDT